jgi:hypothetical protein
MTIRGVKAYLDAEQPSVWLFNGRDPEIDGRAGGDFDSRYSQRGVQWAVKQAENQYQNRLFLLTFNQVPDFLRSKDR